jgi:serine/threonine-protein kinase
MANCPECGSQVAESDLFCPYCGISLTPIAVGGDSDIDEFASTVMIDKPEVRVESKSEDPTVTEPSTSNPTEPSNVAERSEDVPKPAILEEFERHAQADDHPASEMDGASVTGDTWLESESHEVLEVSESTQDRAPEGISKSLMPTSPAADDSEAGSYEQASPDDPQRSEVVQILKPAEELNTTDPSAGPSTFDSVRIVDMDSVPSTGDVVKFPDPHPAEEEAKVSENTTATEQRGHTAPNIGLVDTDGRKGAKLKPLEEGTILNNRYEIIRKIGGGGMGAVYLASDNNLGGVLRAVKEMVQAHIEEEQQAKAIEDFRRESMILSQLDHPSIPTIYDYFYDESEGRFYLVMKYISGGDLAARLRSSPEGRLDELTVAQWGVQIADVLDYLHSQPTTIVYRDLKPSNVMLDGNTGRIVLIDFGIARSINQKQEKGVTAVGTMGYAPPELFSGNVEPRSDIYSLGSTMFHLLTGADPQSNPLLIFDFQKNPRPRQINSQLSDQIERFLMQCVEYNADARYSSAAEVRDVLNEHLANFKKGLVTFGVKAAPEAVSLANQAVFCGFCGQMIVATDLFCAFCGAKQPIAQQGVRSGTYGRTAVTAKLVIEGTSELNAPTFTLEKGEILIGRRDPMSNIFPEVDLSKYDPQTKISRRHARIWREGHAYLLEDLGSSNGTVLIPIVHDSIRLTPRQAHALSNGDRIRVGDTTLHFVVG